MLVKISGKPGPGKPCLYKYAYISFIEHISSAVILSSGLNFNILLINAFINGSLTKLQYAPASPCFLT